MVSGACCTRGQPLYTGDSIYVSSTYGFPLSFLTCSDGPCSGPSFDYRATAFESADPSQCCDSQNLGETGTQQGNAGSYYNPQKNSASYWLGSAGASYNNGSPIPGTGLLACNSDLPVVTCGIKGVLLETCQSLRVANTFCGLNTVYNDNNNAKTTTNAGYQATCCRVSILQLICAMYLGCVSLLNILQTLLRSLHAAAGNNAASEHSSHPTKAQVKYAVSAVCLSLCLSVCLSLCLFVCCSLPRVLTSRTANCALSPSQPTMMLLTPQQPLSFLTKQIAARYEMLCSHIHGWASCWSACIRYTHDYAACADAQLQKTNPATSAESRSCPSYCKVLPICHNSSATAGLGGPL